MNEEKRQEIKAILLTEWDKWEYKQELAFDTQQKYIFGPYSDNEIYIIDEYWNICQEIELEKNSANELIS